MTFDVDLSRESELEVRLDYATADGSAAAGEDYLAAAGTLVLAPGATHGVISVPVLGDLRQEGDECFDLVLSGAVNATLKDGAAQGCIANDDLTVSAGDASVGEGDGGSSVASFAIGLSLASAEEVRVDWATADGTAIAGEDYVEASGTAVFPPGVTEVEVRVTVLGDDELEGTETFFLLLSSPVGAHLGDGEGTGFVVDDDDCQSLDLLVNGSAEEPEVGGEIPGWTEVAGNQWSPLSDGVTFPFEGFRYFHAGDVAAGELVQDVDVSGFTRWIDGGIQRFLFEGYVRSKNESVPDTTQIIVEYRDAGGENVLSELATAEIASTDDWRKVTDLRLAPPGTRFVRVRLLSRRASASGRNDGYFDALTLRSLGTPTLEINDPAVVEGDADSPALVFDVSLSCPSLEEVSVDFATRDVSARAGVDYLAAAGHLDFAPGVQHHLVEVPTLGEPRAPGTSLTTTPRRRTCPWSP